MKDDPTKPVKAIYAGLVALLGTLGVAVAEGGISTQEWVTIALATVLAFGGTYGLSNPQVPADPPPNP